MTPADHEALVKRLRELAASAHEHLLDGDPMLLIEYEDVERFDDAATALESLAPVTMTEGQISAAYHRFVTGDEATQHERFRAALVALPNMADGVREILQTIVDEMAGCRSGKCDDHAVRFGHDALVAAQSALAAAPPPTSQWQTMESAPKTTRAILVHCKERSNSYTVCWVSGDQEPGAWYHFGGDGQLYETPTHWQPLPAPPTEQDKP